MEELTLAVYKSKMLLCLLGNVVMLTRNHMSYAERLVKRTVTEHMELKTALFNDKLKLCAIVAVLLIRNIIVRKLCVYGMSIPTVHIVIRNDLLYHKEVHINLGHPKYGVSHMLKADCSLATLTTERIIRFLSKLKGVIFEICFFYVLTIITRTYPTAAHRLKVLIYTHKHASLIASCNVTQKIADIHVNNVIDHIIYNVVITKAEIGKYRECNSVFAPYRCASDFRINAFVNKLQIFLSLFRCVSYGLIFF